MLARAIGRQGSLLALCAAAAIGQHPASRAPTTYTGHVVDEQGAPIAGAAVLVTDFRFVDVADLLAHPPFATGADGAFTVTTTIISGRVVVAAADRQACAVGIFVSSSVSDLGYVVLVPGCKLIGRVRDDTGAPLAGVRITAESSISDPSLGDGRFLQSGAVSDDQGIFTVPCVPRTGLRIRAAADGFATVSRLAAQHAALDLRLRRTGIVRGRVVDRSGAPVAGATLYVASMPSIFPESISSAADGSFAFTAPDARRFRIVGVEETEPWRQLESALLHGPADDIVVAETGADADARFVEVDVVAAESGERLPRFFLSRGCLSSDPARQIFFHSGARSYEGTARIRYEQPQNRPTWVVVDAPGRAFAVVDVPAALDGPLRVALAPESVLSGVVRDVSTNEPMRGVAVRALPKGRDNSTLVTVEDWWPRTDADGRYRIGGLRPGDYQVQAYAPNRPSSSVSTVQVRASAANSLDLVVPPENWIAVRITGEVPAGPPCFVRLGASTGEHQQGFEVALPEPGPQRLAPSRKQVQGFAVALSDPDTKLAASVIHRFGPLGHDSRFVEIWMPSRTRACTGVTFDLGRSEPDGRVRNVALPALEACELRGHVELPGDVVTERIGVIAHPLADPTGTWLRLRRVFATLDGNADFALDLPRGRYRLQLVDLETGIAFHTEEDDLRVRAAEQHVALRPDIHWLEIAIVPVVAGEEPELYSILVEVPPGQDWPPALPLQNSLSDPEGIRRAEVEVRPQSGPLRWLVPARTLRIQGVQNFEILRRGERRCGSSTAGEAVVGVSGAVTRATLNVPSSPSDEELEQGR